MKKIILTKNLHTIVDDDDYSYLSQWKWCADSKGYAVRSERRSETGTTKRKIVLMHREILKVEKSQQVDHISGNVLDNRKSNLRIATHSQNMRNRKLQSNNSTGYKGVWYNRKKDRFIATIKINGQSRTLKYCRTALEAAQIYNEKAVEIYGDFARINPI